MAWVSVKDKDYREAQKTLNKYRTELADKMIRVNYDSRVRDWLDYWKSEALKRTPLKDIKTFYEWLG